MTFESFSKKSSSEKILLAHLEPSKRLLSWEFFRDNIWKKSVDFFVISVEIDGVALREGANNGLQCGEFYFDSKTKELYVRTDLEQDPSDVFAAVTFRMFFSSSGETLPYDLSIGQDVFYEPLLDKTSNFGFNLDHNLASGVALESNGSIDFINSNGYFESIDDKYTFKNKKVKIFLWSRELTIQENK